MYNKILQSVDEIKVGTYTKNLALNGLDIEICEITDTCIRYKFGKNYSRGECICSNKEIILAYINSKGGYGEFYETTN